jgi:ribonucleoside-triphosphate reductase
MNNQTLGKKTFLLSDEFIQNYANKKAPFGFNGLGELVYMRTYSRLKCDSCGGSHIDKENNTTFCTTCGSKNVRNEKWFETVRRVVEGTYSIQKNHINYYDLGWDEEKAQRSAQEMYELMWSMKFLPPGRGLWAMGTDILEKRGLFAALNNCAFVSTEDIDKTLTKPFEFLMDMSMLGVGVGFDVRGEGKIEIKKPRPTTDTNIYVIEDSREGWVKSLKYVLLGYFKGYAIPHFVYDEIRKEGEPVKTFGGIACGPGPLKYMHEQICKMLDECIGQPISITNIVNIMNMEGQCVVAGGIRRTAEIVFGPQDNEEYLTLKDYYWNADKQCYEGNKVERAEYGWTSNNSIFAEIGQDYKKVGKQTALNGEPGYAWLNQMQKYGRIIDLPNWKDKKAKGGNPCLEQTLESFELCCLVETFPGRCETFHEFQRALKYAYLYAKTVTLGQTHWPETNRVMLRNRRVGTSQSGIIKAIEKLGIEEYRNWCNDGYTTIQEYDEIYSDWFGVPRSIKTTSIKPSGTISKLPGETSGMHFPENIYILRRVTLSKVSPLVQKCINAGYKVEDDVVDPSSVKVEFPTCFEGVSRTVDDVSIWEQTSLAAFLQKYWADNQVSCTVTFKPDLSKKEQYELQCAIDDHDFETQLKLQIKKSKSEADQIPYVLDLLQYDLKGISFLPKLEEGVYAQMPEQAITKELYYELINKITPIDFSDISEDSKPEKFCDGDHCVI